jgi:group I intron endonuclease
VGIIYKITNLNNQKSYIGQTRYTLDHRWYGHISDAKRLDYAFSRAIRKYGPESFTREIIEECDNLNEREIFWIDYYQTTNSNIGYNSTEGGDLNPTIYPEIRKKISFSQKQRWEVMSDEMKRRISRTGFKFSEESKKEMSESRKGRIPWNKGIKTKEEVKQKLKGRRVIHPKPLCFNPNLTNSELSRKYKVHRRIIKEWRQRND